MRMMAVYPVIRVRWQSDFGTPDAKRFLAALAELLRSRRIDGYRTTTCEVGSGVSDRISRVLDFVEISLGEAITVADMADVAGWSRFHFTRVFREEVGRSPWSYVREARVRRAREMLEEGRSPAAVAHELGFADQSHLTRTLRAIDGRTPGALRSTPGSGFESGDGSAEGTNVQDIEAAGADNGSEPHSEQSWNLNLHATPRDAPPFPRS